MTDLFSKRLCYSYFDILYTTRNKFKFKTRYKHENFRHF